MSVQYVEDRDDLNQKLEEADKKLVVIDFFANWCGPCRMIGPRLDECAKEHPDIVILKVDVDTHTEIARDFNIVLMPTMIFVKNKEVIETFSGSNYDKVLSKINELKK